MQTKVLGRIHGAYRLGRLGTMFVFEEEMVYRRAARALWSNNNYFTFRYEDIKSCELA